MKLPVLMALALSACGDFDAVARFGVDAGSGAQDASFGETDGATIPPADGDGLFARTPVTVDSSCTAPRVIDCGATACAAGTCCTGDGACCESVGEVTFDLSGCAGLNEDALTNCLAAAGAGDLASFGNVRPLVENDPPVLVAGGNARSDSGLLATQRTDLRTHSVTANVTFRQAEDCGIGCFDTAAVGWVSGDEEPADGAQLRPLAALSYGAARGEVSLVVNGRIVAQFPADFGDDGRSRFQVSALAHGEIQVSKGGALLASRPFAPVAEARLVVFGRLSNPSAEAELPGISELSATVQLCDMPAAWTEYQTITVTGPEGALDPSLIDHPSIANDSRGRLLAFDYEKSILFARESAPGEFELVPIALTADNVPSELGIAGVSDPELMVADGIIAVFLTGEDTEERRSILRAVVDLDSSVVVDSAPIASDAAFSFDAPSVASNPDADLALVMRRTSLSLGSSSLVARKLEMGDWTPVQSVLTELTDDPSGASLGTATVVNLNGSWQVFFGWQRGTRASVRTLRSPNLLSWTEAEASVSPRPGQFDAIGLSSPDALVSGNRISLVYVATDGIARQLALAERPTTDMGTRE